MVICMWGEKMKDFKEFLKNFYAGKLGCGMFTTVNEEGCTVIIDISKDKLKISTYQKNDWIRTDIYHNDEDHTREELYER